MSKVTKSFVVQLDADDAEESGDRTALSGRVESLESGRVGHFRNAQALLRFLRSALLESDSDETGDDKSRRGHENED